MLSLPSNISIDQKTPSRVKKSKTKTEESVIKTDFGGFRTFLNSILSIPSRDLANIS